MQLILPSALLVVIGVLFKGTINISIADLGVVACVPTMVFLRLIGNRPFIAAWVVATVAGFCGAASFIYAYVVIPTRFYMGLWGNAWGLLVGAVATILEPAQLILFLVIAYIKEGSLVPVCHFCSGLCFGLAALLSFNSITLPTIWDRFRSRAN